MNIKEQIQNATTNNELWEIVEIYCGENGIPTAESNAGKSWGEMGDELGDENLLLAEQRWYELGC